MDVVQATNCNKSKLDIHANVTIYMKCHPFISFLLIFYGMPLFILLAVFAMVYLIALPLGLIMGWF